MGYQEKSLPTVEENILCIQVTKRRYKVEIQEMSVLNSSSCPSLVLIILKPFAANLAFFG